MDWEIDGLGQSLDWDIVNQKKKNKKPNTFNKYLLSQRKGKNLNEWSR
jgi:hypothetical protein